MPTKRATHAELRPRFERLLVRCPISECAIFTGKKRHKFGYGYFCMEGRTELAHRAAWILSGREIPADKPLVLHKCDNPSCCNIDHLFLGTHNDNHKDKANKQRGRRSKAGLPYGVQQQSANSWAAKAGINRKVTYFGKYSSPAEASAVALFHKTLYLSSLKEVQE